MTRNKLRNIFLFGIAFFVLFSGSTAKSYGQCGENEIRIANQRFNEGKVDELFELLLPCLNDFTKENKIQAIRLLSMAYIAVNDLDNAEKMVVELLKINPEYQANDIFDSPTFIALITEKQNSSDNLFDTEVVSASKQSQKLSEAPAIISIISAKQLKEFAYTNVAEALNSLPGIDMLNDYCMYNIGIRGVNGGNRAGSRIIKLMIDNQAVSFRSGSENFLGFELIPIDAIDRIEVIRGPSSALYGANAFLGVVNIITKNASQIQGGKFTAHTGILNKKLSYSQTMTIGNKVKNVDFVISGGVSRENRSGLKIKDVPGRRKYINYENKGKRISNEDDISRSYTLFGKLNFNLKKYGHLGFDVNYQGIDKSAQFVDWGALEKANRVSLKNFYIRTKYDKTFSKRIGWNVSCAYSNGRPSDNEILVSQVKVADYQTRKVGFYGIDVATELNYSINMKNKLTLGIDLSNDNHERQTFYRHNILHTFPSNDDVSTATGDVLSDTTFQNLGVYVQGIFYPFYKHRLIRLSSLGSTFGVRYDKHNIYGNVFNFRFGNVFKPFKNSYAKILFGTSYKAPSSTQLYTSLMVPGDLIGNENLKPETALTIEGELGGYIKEKISLEVSGYYNLINDKVELRPYSSNIMAKNTSEIKSSGFELRMQYHFGNIKSHVNYSFQRSTISRYDIYSERKIVVETNLYPTSIIKGGFHVSLPKFFSAINLEGEYTGQRAASAENTKTYAPEVYLTEDEKMYKLDSYFLLNLIVSTKRLQFFKGKETLLSLRITNILDAEYYYPGFNDFDIPGMPRYFDFKLSQQF